MKKSNLKEKATKVLRPAEWLAVCVTAVFLIAAAAITLRPQSAIKVYSASELRALPDRAALVDLNTADAETLQTLPGIGPELAGRIIAYRTEHGPFGSPEELLLVDGIGNKTFSGLEDLVTVSPEEELP